MRKLLIACIAFFTLEATVLADEKKEKPQILASQTDIAGVIPISARWGHRPLLRVVLAGEGVEDRGEFHYGLAWKPRKGFTFDLTAGYAFEQSGVERNHALVLSVWKRMGFLKDTLRFRFENHHRIGSGDPYRYEGYYSVDYWVFGAHMANQGRGMAAGFQLGSGHGLDPFRFEIRHTMGITEGMPNHVITFEMAFDFRR